MNLVTNIVNLNSNATSALIKARHDEAISLFRMALRKTRHLLGQESTALQYGGVHALLTDAPGTVGDPIIYCVSLTDKSEESLNEGDFAGSKFFNRVFAVKNIRKPKDQDRLAPIVMFNLAVAHHKKGISTGSSKELLVATKYYTMTNALIAQQNELDSNLLLLKLAVWNNIGNVRLHFSDLAEAVKCFRQIGMLMACFNGPISKKEDFDFFRVNVVISLQWATWIDLIAPAA